MSLLNITVAYSCPEWAGERLVQVAIGATISDAIMASAIAEHIQNFSMSNIACGVWGKARAINFVLREGDRVEIYRPLQADPKDARRAKVPTKSYRKSAHT